MSCVGRVKAACSALMSVLVWIGSCGPGLHAAAFMGCILVLSSIFMQLMQAVPHQQIFLDIHGTLRFVLLPASTTYRADVF